MNVRIIPIIFCLLCLSFLLCLSCKSQQDTLKTKKPLSDKQVIVNETEFDDKFFLKMLDQIDSAVVYLLKHGQQLPNDSLPMLGGYVINKKSEKLALHLQDSLVRLLADSAAHYRNEMVKNCTFYPEVGIEIYSKGKSMQVFNCFYCDSWKFVSEKNQVRFSDSDLARERLLKILLQPFPELKYILQLEAKNTSRKKQLPKTLESLEAWMGEVNFDLIADDTTLVDVYLLDVLAPEDMGIKPVFYNAGVDQKLPLLDFLLKDELKKILTSPDAYSLDNVHKFCTIKPDIGFEIKKGSHSLKVLISFDCDVILLDDGKKVLSEDIETSRLAWLSLIRQIFPADKYLKTIRDKRLKGSGKAGEINIK